MSDVLSPPSPLTQRGIEALPGLPAVTGCLDMVGEGDRRM